MKLMLDIRRVGRIWSLDYNSTTVFAKADSHSRTEMPSCLSALGSLGLVSWRGGRHREVGASAPVYIFVRCGAVRCGVVLCHAVGCGRGAADIVASFFPFTESRGGKCT